MGTLQVIAIIAIPSAASFLAGYVTGYDGGMSDARRALDAAFDKVIDSAREGGER